MTRARATRIGLALALACIFALSTTCSSPREREPLAPVYRDDVSLILARRCDECHAGATPKGGWSSDGFFGAIGCVVGDVPAILPPDARAPILGALADDTHRDIATSEERLRIAAWIGAGSPAFRGTVHAPSIVDPRSPVRHGALLREARWAQMLDGTRPDACGRCHEGAPARPPGVTLAAPGATSCTSCHTGPKGPLECGTCHGDGAPSAFPRTKCFFPNDSARTGAHAAHTSPSKSRSVGLACSTCHPSPGESVIGGSHGTGAVEIVFDANAVGGEASYDKTTGACTVACHNRGGARPKPTWSERAPMTCGDCHSVPPKSHYPGACTSCHADADAGGTKTSGALHVNGRVDLGDGSGGCGACHGKGTDPWPTTGAHPRHAKPDTTLAVACADCHVVPSGIVAGGGHFDGVVGITFAGRAKSRGAVPIWDGKTCSSVACHGGALVDDPPLAPTWKSGAPGGACGDCHGTPPPFQHTTSTTCERSECHGSEVERGKNLEPLISFAGTKLHIDGLLQP